MVLFYAHDDFLDHDTGPGHPECADRLRSVYARMKFDEFGSIVRWMDAPKIDPKLIPLAHEDAYVKRIMSSQPDVGLAHLDGDTVMSPGTLTAALRAAGAVVDAVDQVMIGPDRQAFCAVRPPGHHAEADQAMGFCLFNNVAIAAKYALKFKGLKRVAIIDFDVHHGNGTQHIMEDEAGVMYVSTHEAPLYPGTGTMAERGKHNNILNIPLRPKTGSDDFRTVARTMMFPSLENFAPQLVFVSAGFDAHKDDPLASLRFSEADYAWITGQLMKLAQTSAEGRVVSVLEGGYNLTALAESVAAHVMALSEHSRV